MSLDVYLEGPETEEKCICRDCWNEHTKKVSECFYSANITHNLTKMAEEAGIYMYLWRPEEIQIKMASELIEPLEIGLSTLKADPNRFNKFNAPNGWGLYEHFVPFVEEYLNACKEYPDSLVRASR